MTFVNIYLAKLSEFSKKLLTTDENSCIVKTEVIALEITVAEKIRLIMKRQKLTIESLATATGQSRQNLSNKMTRGNFSEKDIRSLAKALDCDAEIKFTLKDGTKI